MDEIIFTTKTLAERWSCCVDTVEAMLRRGEVRAFRVGHRWRIAESAVLEHEATRQQVAS
jgi:excisionase family DNA binding protein